MASTIVRRLRQSGNNANNLIIVIRNNHRNLKPSRFHTLASNQKKVSTFFQNDPSNHFPFKSAPTFLNHHHIRTSSTARDPPPEPSRNQEEQPDPYPSQNPNFKHQEIEGPTVERDMSALANETRAAIDAAMRAMYGLSSGAAALGLVQLGVGAWAAYTARAAEVSTEAAAAMALGVVGFAFPFSLALALRRSLKPIYFFKKMEEQGRLQILTLSLQALKGIGLLFVRLRGASLICVAALSTALFYFLFFFN